MATQNYFIAYDLVSPGQNYEAVRKAILECCEWSMKLQFSLYYVKSSLSAAEIYKKIRTVQDTNDKLAVVQASNAVISTVNDNQAKDFLSLWNSGFPARAA